MAATLLDTNVLSELRKGERCNARVRTWFMAQADAELFISVLAIAEIRDGIERLRRRDPSQAGHLENWLRQTETGFADRILPITVDVADHWGRMPHGQPLPDFDRLIAATASFHGLQLATRNTRDFLRSGVTLVNPWEA